MFKIKYLKKDVQIPFCRDSRETQERYTRARTRLSVAHAKVKVRSLMHDIDSIVPITRRRAYTKQSYNARSSSFLYWWPYRS